jgi:transcriptional regulator with XRE-family HTH domain
MTSSGQIVGESRRSKNLTQEELAERIGVSRQTIAMWEIGRRLPTENVAILTARFLELDEAELLSLLQYERLIFHVERLQDQYGATIVIAGAPDHGGITMNNMKHEAYQTQQGVHFAVTHIHKSIGFGYPQELVDAEEELNENRKAFDAPFEKLIPEESLVIKMLAHSENKEFVPNGFYVGDCEVVDDLGNYFRPFGMGTLMGGGTVQAYALLRYIPEAKSISLRQKIGNARREDCDFILFEDVRLTDHEVSKQMDSMNITYEGVGVVKIGKIGRFEPYKEITQIHIRLPEDRNNAKYVGISEFTDNLGNEYKVAGRSWNMEDKTSEGFAIEGLAPEAESISFKYLLAKTVLDFQFSDLPIPS